MRGVEKLVKSVSTFVSTNAQRNRPTVTEALDEWEMANDSRRPSQRPSRVASQLPSCCWTPRRTPVQGTPARPPRHASMELSDDDLAELDLFLATLEAAQRASKPTHRLPNQPKPTQAPKPLDAWPTQRPNCTQVGLRTGIVPPKAGVFLVPGMMPGGVARQRGPLPRN